MEVFRLWGVYTDLTEQWVRETGDYLVSQVNNPNVQIIKEYFSGDSVRASLYGWERFPLFVAVKHNQPFRKKVGKFQMNEYNSWLQQLGWKIDNNS